MVVCVICTKPYLLTMTMTYRMKVIKYTLDHAAYSHYDSPQLYSIYPKDVELLVSPSLLSTSLPLAVLVLDS
jgi:hypothetical protein